MMSETSGVERYLMWAEVLERHGCDQLANGLRWGCGIGQQIESPVSLNSHYVENPYVEVIGALAAGGLAGLGEEVVRRQVDAAFIAAGVLVDQGERDVLAYLLNEGTIHP